MKYCDTDLVAEVRRNREDMLEEHGGYERYTKYLSEQRKKLEDEGWHFATPDEIARGQQMEIRTARLTR